MTADSILDETTPSSIEPSHKRLALIGAAVFEGQTKYGVNEAPQKLRTFNLTKIFKSFDLIDCGDITTSQLLQQPKVINQIIDHRHDYYNEDEIIRSEPLGRVCHLLSETVEKQARHQRFVLTLGGDHSIAVGTISGMLKVYPDLYVIWLDAHGDMNTPETSLTHLYHGMPFAHLLGWFKKTAPGFEWLHNRPCLPESSAALLGHRDLDLEEANLLNKSQLLRFSSEEVRKRGMKNIAHSILNAVGSRPLHLSFDIDVCDPSIAPGTGTPVPNGLTIQDIDTLLCLLKKARCVSMDLVEINPLYDDRQTQPTVQLALHFLSIFFS